MGEYAKHNGEQVKIGTCESMYYLRYEQRHTVEPLPGNVNPHTDKNLFWRLPFPDEDHVKPGYFEPYNRGLRLFHPVLGDFYDEDLIKHPGNIQLHSREAGLHANVKCYHGMKLPDNSTEARFFWNGKSHSFELIAVKNTDEGFRAVYQCRHCQSMWSTDEWDKILEYVYDAEMKRRLKLLVEFQDELIK